MMQCIYNAIFGEPPADINPLMLGLLVVAAPFMIVGGTIGFIKELVWPNDDERYNYDGDD